MKTSAKGDKKKKTRGERNGKKGVSPLSSLFSLSSFLLFLLSLKIFFYLLPPKSEMSFFTRKAGICKKVILFSFLFKKWKKKAFCFPFLPFKKRVEKTFFFVFPNLILLSDECRNRNLRKLRILQFF